jgi:hypothetical protein
MKKLLLFTVLGYLFLICPSAGAQCTSDAFLDKCASSLGEFTFIKSFNITIDKKTAESKYEYSYVFSKGSTYKIIICDENIEGNKMIVTLFDRNHKMIATNFNKASKKFYPLFSYPCSATGVYYLEVTFENGKEGCGVNILGFNKSTN